MGGDVVLHKVYLGRRHRGNQLYEYGKCSCGAVLEGQDAIDKHLQDNRE